MKKTNCSRRQFLKIIQVVSGLAVFPGILSCTKRFQVEGLSSLPDKNGLLLPPNCRSRVIAQSGKKVGKTNHVWHSSPDGGGVVPTDSGGWIYISNSEMEKNQGGVGAIEFNSEGAIISAYSILTKSTRNCGGCVTPWNSWLSCEEVTDGVVWECDPYGKKKAIPYPALGIFYHESIIVDPQSNVCYLTEDEVDGCFYRFLPSRIRDNRPNFSAGSLEVAMVDAHGYVSWEKIRDPFAKKIPTRKQVNGAAIFKGGEGITYHDRKIFFDTKFDHKIWKYDISSNKLSIYYAAEHYENPILTNPDALTMFNATILVCEDGGDMQVVAITPLQTVKPILQLIGQDSSEITGISLSPDKTRLYFSSQRGNTGSLYDGITYEVVGIIL